MKLVSNSVDGFLTVNGIEILNFIFFNSLSKEDQKKLSDAIYQMAFKLEEYEATNLEPSDIMKLKWNIGHLNEIIEKKNSDL